MKSIIIALLSFIILVLASNHDLTYAQSSKDYEKVFDAKNTNIQHSHTWPIEYILTESKGQVNSVSISPNGELIAYGVGDGTPDSPPPEVYIHSLSDGQLTQVLTEAERSVESVTFTPNSKSIVYGGLDRNVYIQAINGELLQSLDDGKDWVIDLDISNDGKYIAHGGHEGTLRPEAPKLYVHTTEDGEIYRTFEEAEIWIESVAFSADRDHIAYSEKNYIYIHSMNDGLLENEISETDGTVFDIAYSFDNKYLAYGGGDSVYIHSVDDNLLLNTTLSEANSSIRSINFSSDSKKLAYGTIDGYVYIHDTQDWDLVNTLTEAEGSITSIDFSADGERLAYSSSDGKVYVHNKTLATSNKSVTDVPEKLRLSQNYPNPFNPATQISYKLPKQAHLSLKVYNVLGEHITTLVNEFQSPGRYEVTFDASHLSSGIYIYRLEAGEFVESTQMMLVK